MSKSRIQEFESVLFEGIGPNSSDDEGEGDINFLTSDIVNMKNKLRKWVIKHFITGDAIQYLLRILEDCNILSPKEASTLKKCLASSVQNSAGSQKKETTDANLPIILREIKSLKKALHYSIEKQYKITKFQVEKNNKLYETQSEEKCVLPKMPFESRDAFEEFNRELQENDELLEQFKLYISKQPSNDLVSFGCGCMRKLMTDGLASKYTWKDTKNKPGLENMFVMLVMNEIATQSIPNVTVHRIGSVFQNYLERIRKRLKTEHVSDERSTMTEDEDSIDFDTADIAVENKDEEPRPSKSATKRRRIESKEKSVVNVNENAFVDMKDFPNLPLQEDPIEKFEFCDDETSQPDYDLTSTIDSKGSHQFKMDMEAKVNALGIILHKALIKHKEIMRQLSYSLKDATCSLTDEKVNIFAGKPTFELQFKDVELFERFEKEIQSDPEKYAMLVSQLNNLTAKGEEKYIKSCWRHIMEDVVAQNFCWKGTLVKGAIQPMATTAAIKEAFNTKYPAASQLVFEQTAVAFFQQAKARYIRKLEYQSKSLKTM